MSAEVPRAIDRTKPRFPTDGPGDGRSWREYFEAMRAADAPVSEAQEPEERPVVIEPPYDLTDEQISALSSRGTPAQVVKRLKAHKWDIRVQKSVVHMPPTRRMYATDEHEAGSLLTPDYYLETTTVGAVKRDARGRVGLAMFAVWNDRNGFQIAETYDPLDGREIRVGYMKGRKPNQIEIEEDIAPPLGLREWLADFAPTAADKKNAEKKAAQAEARAAQEAAMRPSERFAGQEWVAA